MEDNFEKSVQHKVQGFKLEPSAAVWTQVQKGLDQKKKKSKKFFLYAGYLAAACLCGLIGYFAGLNQAPQKSYTFQIIEDVNKPTNKHELTNAAPVNNYVSAKHASTQPSPIILSNENNIAFTPSITQISHNQLPQVVKQVVQANMAYPLQEAHATNLLNQQPTYAAKTIYLPTVLSSYKQPSIQAVALNVFKPITLAYATSSKKQAWYKPFVSASVGYSAFNHAILHEIPKAITQSQSSGTSLGNDNPLNNFSLKESKYYYESTPGVHAAIGLGAESKLNNSLSVVSMIKYLFQTSSYVVGKQSDYAPDGFYFYTYGNNQKVQNQIHSLVLANSIRKYINIKQSKTQLFAEAGAHFVYNASVDNYIKDDLAKIYYKDKKSVQQFGAGYQLSAGIKTQKGIAVSVEYSKLLTNVLNQVNNQMNWENVSVQTQIPL